MLKMSWNQPTTCRAFKQWDRSNKGDPLRKEVYDLLAADASLNFIGNVEARDLMDHVADVYGSGWLYR